MERFDVPLPVKGLSVNRHPEKSRELVDMRTVDTTSGRKRFATRPGAEKVVNAQVSGSSAVRALGVTSFDDPLFTFAQYAEDAEVEEWSKETPLTSDCRALRINDRGDVVALDGRAGVAIFNKAGELVTKFAPAVKDTEHIIRALEVGPDGEFYIGVSEGGDQDESRMWKYRLRGDGSGEPNLEWEIVLGVYVERIRLRAGVLYCALNNARTGQAFLRAYRQIDTSVPEVAWNRDQVPYPINDLSVRNKDGALLTAHPANTTRGYYLGSLNTTKVAEDWTPQANLTDFNLRIWSDLNPDNVDGLGNNETSDGAVPTTFFDSSEALRYAVQHQSSDITSDVVYRSNVIAGHGAFLFDGLAALNGRVPSSTTGPGSGMNRGLLATHDDAWWAGFIVGRATPGTVKFPILVYTQAGNQEIIVVLNCSAIATGGAAPYAATISAGGVTMRVGSVVSTSLTFDSTNGYFIIAISMKTDGAASGGLFSVNGRNTPTAFTGTNAETTAPVQLGAGYNTYLTGTEIIDGTVGTQQSPMRGEIYRFISFRDYVPTGGSKTIISSADFQKIEGWLGWRYGLAHLFESSHPYVNQPPTADALPGTSDSPYLYLTDAEPMMVKWDPNAAKPRWVVKDDSSGTGTGGLGSACIWPDNSAIDYCFSVGPTGAGSGGTPAQQLTNRSNVRRVKDNGDSASVTGTGTWEDDWPSEPTYTHPRIAVSGKTANDPGDGTAISYLYVPFHAVATGTQNAVYAYLSGGTAAGTNTETGPLRTIILDTGSRGYAVDTEPFLPEYSPGLNSSLIDERIAIGTPKEGSSDEAVTLVRLVAATRTTPDPSSTYVLAVAGNTMKHASSSSMAALAGSVTVSTTGHISLAAYGGKIFGTDGNTLFQVDPRAANGILKLWKPTSSGELLRGAQILGEWQRRIGMGRGSLEPNLVRFTAVGNPYDVDTIPPVPSGFEAVEFETEEAVTGIIPLSDDLCLVGMLTKVGRITGDPSRGGLQFDRVADLYGIAFGEAWCKDPLGRTYVFESRGSVSRIDADGRVLSLSDEDVRPLMEEIDLEAVDVRMVWNVTQEGLHVFQTPRGSTSPTTAYFWKRTGEWFKDELGFTVSSARTVGSEVWLGGQDGYVRKVGGVDDDGVSIYARMTTPEISIPGFDLHVSRPRLALARELGGATVALLASDDSEIPDIEDSSWDADAGRNRKAPIHARGAYVYVRVRGNGQFAIDGIDAEMDVMGERRPV